MKTKIYLTESELHEVIRNSVVKIIKEHGYDEFGEPILGPDDFPDNDYYEKEADDFAHEDDYMKTLWDENQADMYDEPSFEGEPWW